MRGVAAFTGAAVLACALPASAGSTVYVRGRVLDGTGSPVRGARVSFELHPDREIYDQRDCEVRPSEDQCRVHRVAGLTDAAGRYRLPVRLSSYLAKPRSHVLAVTDRAVPGAVTPARTQIHFYFARKSIDVVDLRMWRTHPSADPTSPVHRSVSVDPLTASYGRLYSAGPTLELLQGSDVVWTYPEVTEERRVDARTVETGTTAIRASDTAIIGALVVSYVSPSWPLTGSATPLSRKARCFTYGRDDALLPLSGCRFTDGRLGARIDSGYQQVHGKSCNVASQCDHPRWVLVDLGAPQPVGAVAVRGCVADAIEASFDGTLFTAYPTNDLGDGLLVGPPLPARYVRFDLANCIFGATELSVFGPL